VIAVALAALATLSALPARAQIEMTDASGGNVGIGTSPLSNTRLYVVNDDGDYGVRGVVTGGSKAFGVYGSAQGSIWAYGVYGTTAPGGSNRYAGYFVGDVYVTGSVIELSDGRFKVDVRDLGSIEDPQGRSVLGRVLALEPRAYRFTDDPAYASLNLPAGEQYGFLAQEVATVFPDLVREGVHPAEGDGEPLVYQAVDYVHLVPVLVQALQEQQAEIAALRTRLDALDGGGG